MRNSGWSWLGGALLLGAAVCAGAQSTPEYQAKVILMDKLTRFVDWPPRAAARCCTAAGRPSPRRCINAG